MRTVQCVLLKKEAEGLSFVPHPGELGERIYQSVSKEGWAMWLKQLQVAMNENFLITADPTCLPVVEKFMQAYLFQEGPYADMQFDAID